MDYIYMPSHVTEIKAIIAHNRKKIDITIIQIYNKSEWHFSYHHVSELIYRFEAYP